MSRPQILIVEDEGIVAHDLKRRVTRMGFDAPQISSTADDAITQAERFHPNLVLMDINLKGGGDGVTAAETIRSSLGIPVVFLTVSSDEDTLRRAMASDPCGYVLKPFKETELRMTIDIALRNHAAARNLQDDHTRIASTLSSIADGVICVGANGKVLTMNPAAESITGWSEHEAERRPIGQVLHVEDEVVSWLTSEAMQSSSSRGLHSLTVRRRNNSAPVPTEVHVAPLYTQGHRPYGSVIVMRDVKNRLNGNAKLQTRDRASILVDASPDTIFRLDRSGTVLDAHLPGADSASGEGLIGSNLYSSLLPSPVVDQILTAIRYALEKNEIRTLEFELPSPTGILRKWFHIVASGNDQAVMIVRDITALGLPGILSEVAIRDLMNKEMETLSEAVEEALNIPLSVTERLCDHLTTKFKYSLRLEGRACVRLIKETSAAIRDRMDDVTFYLSLKARPVEKTHVSMHNLAVNVGTEVALRYGSRRARVSVGTVPECFGSEPLLRRLLSALLDNAFKFTRRRSEPIIEFGSHKSADGVVYFIRDNGVGFDDRHSNRIFAAFQRLHTGASYSGIGLGLSIAQRIIERHGGQIWAEGKLGKGAVVSFTLPYN